MKNLVRYQTIQYVLEKPIKVIKHMHVDPIKIGYINKKKKKSGCINFLQRNSGECVIVSFTVFVFKMAFFLLIQHQFRHKTVHSETCQITQGFVVWNNLELRADVFLPWPWPERQAMVMSPPCWKVTHSHLTEQTRTDMSEKPATGVQYQQTVSQQTHDCLMNVS